MGYLVGYVTCVNWFPMSSSNYNPRDWVNGNISDIIQAQTVDDRIYHEAKLKPDAVYNW